MKKNIQKYDPSLTVSYSGTSRLRLPHDRVAPTPSTCFTFLLFYKYSSHFHLLSVTLGQMTVIYSRNLTKLNELLLFSGPGALGSSSYFTQLQTAHYSPVPLLPLTLLTEVHVVAVDTLEVD